MLVTLPGPHPGALAHPSIPKVLQAKEHTPIPSPSILFTFGLEVESIKELGGTSIIVNLVMHVKEQEDYQLKVLQS
jgi:hypothetical protein